MRPNIFRLLDFETEVHGESSTIGIGHYESGRLGHDTRGLPPLDFAIRSALKLEWSIGPGLVSLPLGANLLGISAGLGGIDVEEGVVGRDLAGLG